MEPQEKLSSESTTVTTEAPGSPLQEFAKAFNESTKKAEPAEKLDTGGKPAPKAKPKDFKSLAETLGVEVKDLYDIQVPSAREGTEPFTLGKLKDLAAEQDSFAIRTLRFEEDARRKEAALITTERELKELMSVLPKEALKPEALKAVRDRHAANLLLERQKTLEAIQEWQDAGVRENELKGMVEHLTSYGLPETLLLEHYSSALIKYVRDNWLREQRIQKALGAVTERLPSQHGKSKPQEKAPVRAAAAPQTVEQQRVADFVSTLNQAGKR